MASPWSAGAYGQAATAQKRVEASGGPKPFKLAGRSQAALVRAQLASNDLVAALKIGGGGSQPWPNTRRSPLLRPCWTHT
jgi:hypothetical protein